MGGARLPDLSTEVMDFTLFPGLRKEPLRALLSSEGLKGVIMRTFGAGNAMPCAFFSAVDRALVLPAKGDRLVIGPTDISDRLQVPATKGAARDRGVRGIRLTTGACSCRIEKDGVCDHAGRIDPAQVIDQPDGFAVPRAAVAE